jgi:hypothetical protein
LRIAAFRGDPHRAANDAKSALGKQGRVVELAKLFAAQTPDLATKKKVEDAAHDLDMLIPQQVLFASRFLSLSLNPPTLFLLFSSGQFGEGCSTEQGGPKALGCA